MCKCVWHIRFHAHSERFGTVFRCLYVYLYRYGFSAIGFKLTYELWIHLICTRTYKTSNKCPHEFFFFAQTTEISCIFTTHSIFQYIYIWKYRFSVQFDIFFDKMIIWWTIRQTTTQNKRCTRWFNCYGHAKYLYIRCICTRYYFEIQIVDSLKIVYSNY